MPGTAKDKQDAVDDLARFWKKRTGSMPKMEDNIRIKAWLTIAREAIVEKLLSKGLQLKLTASRRHIY